MRSKHSVVLLTAAVMMFAGAASALEVGPNQSLTLNPGDISAGEDLVIDPNGALSLNPGTYNLNSVTVHGDGWLNLVGATTLIVNHDVSVRDEQVVYTEGSLPPGVSIIGTPSTCQLYGCYEAQGMIQAFGQGGTAGTSGPSGTNGSNGLWAHWSTSSGNEIFQATPGGSGQGGNNGSAGSAGSANQVSINAGGNITIDGQVFASGGPSGGQGGAGGGGGSGGAGGWNATWTVPSFVATNPVPLSKEEQLRQLGQGAPGGGGASGANGGNGGSGADGTTLALNAAGTLSLGPTGTIETQGAYGGTGGAGGTGGRGGSGVYSVESQIAYSSTDVRRIRLDGTNGGNGGAGGNGGNGGTGGTGGNVLLQGQTVNLQGAIDQGGGSGATGGSGGNGGNGASGGNSFCCLPGGTSLNPGSGSGGIGGNGGNGGAGGQGGAGGNGGSVYVRAFSFTDSASLTQGGGSGGGGGNAGIGQSGGSGGMGLNWPVDPLNGGAYSVPPSPNTSTPVSAPGGINGQSGQSGSAGGSGSAGSLYTLTTGFAPISTAMTLLSFRQSGNPDSQAQIVQVNGRDAIQLETGLNGSASTNPFSLSQLIKLGDVPLHFELGYRWMNALSSDGILDIALNDVTLFELDHNGTAGGSVTSMLGLAYQLVQDAVDASFSLLSFDLPSLASLPGALAATFDGSGIGTLAMNLYPGSPVGIQLSSIDSSLVPGGGGGGTSAVPEPSTLALLGLGLVLVAAARYRLRPGR